MASCLFCPEQVKLLNQFFKDENLLEYLFEFLLSDQELNATLSGYFSKACDCLMMVNPERFLSVFFQNGFDNGLLRHLYTSSISDVLVKVLVLSGELSQFLPNFVVLTNNCMEMMRCQDVFVTILASQVMQRVINVNFERLFAIYLSKNFLTDLLKGIQNSEEFIVKGKLKVLVCVLGKNGLRTDAMLQGVLQVLIPVLAEMMEKFERNLEMSLLVIEVIRAACALDCEVCNGKVVEFGLVEKALELMEKFPWSSVLHNLVLALVRVVLAGNYCLTEHLVKDIKLQNTILKYSSNPYILKRSSKVRAGFVAHLFVMANDLVRKLRDNQTLTDYLSTSPSWLQFSSSTLNQYNIIENKQLGYCDTKVLDTQCKDDLLNEEELKDFEVLEEKTDQALTPSPVNLPITPNPKSESSQFTDENKENKSQTPSEKLLNISNSLVDKLLSETLSELVNGVSQSLETDSVPTKSQCGALNSFIDQTFPDFNCVNFWKVSIKFVDLEEL